MTVYFLCLLKLVHTEARTVKLALVSEKRKTLSLKGSPGMLIKVDL